MGVPGGNFGTRPDRAANHERMDYIEQPGQLQELADSLALEPLLAVDTEAAGYHRYADRVCLLQLSTRRRTFVVDALALDLAPLRSVFADTSHEIVIHDAEYDLRLLARDFTIGIGRLFDTKLAAQFLGEPAIGLAGLVEKHLAVRLDKKHQRADWAQRPLPRELLEYAADDTRYLAELRDRLRTALEELGRLHWAEEEFALRAAADFSPAQADGDGFLRLKNTRDLGPRQLAALREVYGWRDDMARERDLAPFRVVSNEVLAAIARGMPESVRELTELEGINAAGVRHARDLVAAVRRARELPESALPVRRRGPRRPAADPAFESLVERLKTVRDETADRLAMDRGFLMPRQQLEDIARARPRTLAQLRAIPEMRNWQVEVLGDALLEVLR